MNEKVLAGTALGGIAGAIIGVLATSRPVTVPDEVMEALQRFTFKDTTTGQYVVHGKPLHRFDYIREDNQHKATRVVFGFEDRYNFGPVSARDYDFLDVIVKVDMDMEEKRFDATIVQCGADGIEVYYEGNLVATFEELTEDNLGQVLGRYIVVRDYL
ncbi:hypothetical protein J7J18_03835 [bacterium]|nr:hypothetical protein [bacterium]